MIARKNRPIAMLRGVIIAVFLAGSAAPALAEHVAPAGPDPSLSPVEVVTIVMEALRRNDTPHKNFGIEVAFNFASPANKAATGPLERFTSMVRGPVYRPMINHRKIEFGTVAVAGETARIEVIIVSIDGRSLGFRFMLSRRPADRLKGSWMTDAVVPFRLVSL